ncbi:hypothetical protein WJX75_001847 [Coccomyxa subellipsoidea]|uniref:RNase H type-1 domain-containing protein n=1 Tax=Coccomyxa subellipsoidea TaxID=248742 RepID=A0ABR2YRH9_9CHLO
MNFLDTDGVHERKFGRRPRPNRLPLSSFVRTEASVGLSAPQFGLQIRMDTTRAASSRPPQHVALNSSFLELQKLCGVIGLVAAKTCCQSHIFSAARDSLEALTEAVQNTLPSRVFWTRTAHKQKRMEDSVGLWAPQFGLQIRFVVARR